MISHGRDDNEHSNTGLPKAVTYLRLPQNLVNGESADCNTL